MTEKELIKKTREVTNDFNLAADNYVRALDRLLKVSEKGSKLAEELNHFTEVHIGKGENEVSQELLNVANNFIDLLKTRILPK